MLRRLWLRGLLNAITLIYTILFAALTGNNTAITQQITTATTTRQQQLQQQLQHQLQNYLQVFVMLFRGNDNKTAAHCYRQCVQYLVKKRDSSLPASLAPSPLYSV